MLSHHCDIWALHCCVRASSSCRVGISLIAALRLLTARLFLLQLTGLVALWHVESSQTRSQTHVSYTGRQILFFFWQADS